MDEQGVQEGLSMRPCGELVLRISEVEVLVPTFTTWGRPSGSPGLSCTGQGSDLEAQSLMMTLEGTMVLNAEL